MASKFKQLLKKTGTAAITALLFFYVFVYIQQGTIWLINGITVVELVLTFFFLLVLFWVHGLISGLFSAPFLNRLPATLKVLLEGIMVVGTSILLCYLLYFLPFQIIYAHLYPSEGPVIFPAVRVRLAYVVSSITSLFFYYFVERERSRRKLRHEFLRAEQLQKENFKAQLESLKNQVNPHFLFNSLNVLNSLIYTDPEKAARFLDQLAEVYRALLNSSDKQLVSLQEELELAKAYIFLLKTRFGNNVQFRLDVPEACLPLELPPTALQMLLENAIKHNGSTSQKPLQIRIYTEGNQLFVENNRQPRLEEIQSTRVGLQNITSRYKYLTDREVTITQTEQSFKVGLPLLAVASHENTDN